MTEILNCNLDDLEIVDLTHLKVTQEEMMKKLSILDDESCDIQTLQSKASQKKRFGFKSKGWTWKQSPIKSSSIEEEPPLSALLLESPSPKKSLSSKSSTPNQSPKHRISSSETIRNCSSDEATSFRRRKNIRPQQQQQPQQTNTSNSPKTELRSSASARLIQLFDSKDGIDKLSSDYEFYSLLPENGRPASIHVIQTIKSDDI